MGTVSEIQDSVEAERLKVLKRFEVLDTPPDGNLDGLTKLAARLFNMPLSLVSVVDNKRIWFKSRCGLEIQEVPRQPGFCSSAILYDECFVVEDASLHTEAKSNLLVVGEVGVRFYAGFPLKTKEGLNLGVFCVMDRKPRRFSDSDKEILQTMAEMALNLLELRMEVRTAMKHQHHILNTAAHDLKNPLSIMPLLADLIIHHKNDPAAIDEIALQIKEAGKRMSTVIEMLLETAMEEAGRILLRLKAIPFTSLVQGVINSNAALAKNKNQKLEFVVKEECMVYADSRRLTEVVDNLVNNAIKYSQIGGAILVELDVKDKWAVIKVQDDGQGLTKDDLKNLYRRFTSLSATPTGGESSTGLGLSIVKNIVDAHHGKITASSEGKDKGATFVVELPLSENV